MGIEWGTRRNSEDHTQIDYFLEGKRKRSSWDGRELVTNCKQKWTNDELEINLKKRQTMFRIVITSRTKFMTISRIGERATKYNGNHTENNDFVWSDAFTDLEEGNNSNIWLFGGIVATWKNWMESECWSHRKWEEKEEKKGRNEKGGIHFTRVPLRAYRMSNIWKARDERRNNGTKSEEETMPIRLERTNRDHLWRMIERTIFFYIGTSLRGDKQIIFIFRIWRK